MSGFETATERQDYINALAVIGEATAPVRQEQYQRALHQVFDEACLLTYESSLDAIVEEAEDITFENTPEKAVEEAEDITYFYGEYAPMWIRGYKGDPYPPKKTKALDKKHKAIPAFVPLRPERPNDLEVEELVSGARVVVYNSKLSAPSAFAKHEVIVSEPYEKMTENGTKYQVVLARRVDHHLSDNTPLESPEGVREVALSSWGMTPNAEGLYNRTKFVEMFVGQKEPLQYNPHNPRR